MEDEKSQMIVKQLNDLKYCLHQNQVTKCVLTTWNNLINLM